jgi:hypothetical protein
MAQEGWSASYAPSWLIRAPATENLLHLAGVAGPVVFVLALVGIAIELWPQERRINTDAAVMAALVCSLWLFHSFVVPVRDARHLLAAVPPLLLLSASALAAIARTFSTANSSARRVVIAFGSITAAVFLVTGRMDRAQQWGAQTAVRQVLARSGPLDNVLVSSDSYGEGVFIAALVERERRPGHQVIRASKALSASNWDGSGYNVTNGSVDDVEQYLHHAHIRIVVLDMESAAARPALAHHRQLLDVVRLPDHWRRVDATGSESRFAVFESVGP